jgi:DNA phosphorothioation-dependent restriction protein DptG
MSDAALKRLLALCPSELGDKHDPKNFVEGGRYLPFRYKSKEIDYREVFGRLASHLFGKQLKPKSGLDAFADDCEVELEDRIGDPVSNALMRGYFGDESARSTSVLEDIGPVFSLLRTSRSTGKASSHVADIFLSVMNDDAAKFEVEKPVSFIDKIFSAQLESHLVDAAETKGVACYLPFLAEKFRADLKFALGPDGIALRAQTPGLLELYNFLYCAQLALNIEGFEEEPKARPLYFIVDGEKASQERAGLRDSGWRQLHDSVGLLFPLLSLLDFINGKNPSERRPLWRYGASLGDSSKIANDQLHAFAEKYRELRGMDSRPKCATTSETFGQLRDSAIKSFSADVSSERADVCRRTARTFETNIASRFVQSRGRAGKVLVLNQDIMLLLTNVVIGNRPRLHLPALLDGFRCRGIWFDKASRRALVDFFERAGNVERLSDSGDAIYVRKSI